MKLIKEGAYWYIRGAYNRKRYHISTKQTVRAKAVVLYNMFCEKLFDVIIPEHLQRAIDDLERVSSSKKRVRFDEVKDEYLNYTKEKNSKNNIQTKIKVFNEVGQVVDYIDEVGQSDIDRLIGVWSELSSATKKTYFSKIKTFLRWAVRKSYYSADALVVIEFPAFRSRRSDIVISELDFNTILQTVDNPDFAMYLYVLWSTGMRVNEPCSLRVRDICTVKNRGRKVVYLRVWQSKVNKNKQCILCDDVAGRLILFCRGRVDSDLIFKAWRIGDNKQYYSRRFQRLMKHLGWQDKHYTLSAFRHTYATRLLDLTGDIEFVSNQLGHSNIETTAGYIHRGVFAYARVMERLAG